jgi:RNA polymerase sigma factor (sigma-70 family)
MLVVDSETLDNESDGQLIRRYAEGRDEQAFAKLVERRGALVAGTCARMLRNYTDADDAFQAVFLVLARRGYALRRQTSLAAWLHGVAVRVCLNDRKKERRRQRRVQEAAELAQQDAGKRDELNELKLLIDKELAALPKRLREVLVLCDLEGRSREEAAGSLSLPLGTVSSRLARGRAAMRKRLARHDLAIATGGVALALAQCAEAAPAVSALLVDTTVRNAHTFLYGTAAAKAALGTKITTLAEGALYTMLVNRWKVAVCLVVLLAIALFGGTVGSTIVPGVGTAFGTTIFYDDFENGSATDGDPVMWETDPFYQFTTFNVLEGNLRVGVSEVGAVGVVGVVSDLTDTSIRAQVRLEGKADEHAAVFVRGNRIDYGAHAFEITVDGGLLLGIDNNYTRINSNLRPTEYDVILQLDAIGNSIKAWAWRAGEPMPTTPAFSRTTDLLPIGFPGVYYGRPDALPSGAAIYRYVHVASLSIPEPRGASLAAAGGAVLAGGLFFGRRRVWLAL